MNEYLLSVLLAVGAGFVVWLASLFWEATKRKVKPFLTGGTVESKKVKPKKRTTFNKAVKRQNKGSKNK